MRVDFNLTACLIPLWELSQRLHLSLTSKAKLNFYATQTTLCQQIFRLGRKKSADQKTKDDVAGVQVGRVENTAH